MNFTDRFFLTFLIFAVGMQPLEGGLFESSIIVGITLFFSIVWEFYSNKNTLGFFRGLVT